MQELYELKEKLCKELKKYNNEPITTNSVDVVKKLSASIHYLDEIIEKFEEEDDASFASYNSYGSYRGNSNRSGRGSYNNSSYARGRGRNARRDSMGRYSSEGYSRTGDMVSELKELMMDAPTEDIRRSYEKVISHYETMM